MHPAAHPQIFLRTKFAKKLALQAYVTQRTGVSVRSVRDAKRGRHPVARSQKLRRLVQGGGGGVPLPLPRGLPRRHSAFFAGSRKPFQTSKLAARLGSFSQESAHAPSVPHSEEASTNGGVVDVSAVPRRRLEKHPRGSFARAGWPARCTRAAIPPRRRLKLR